MSPLGLEREGAGAWGEEGGGWSDRWTVEELWGEGGGGGHRGRNFGRDFPTGGRKEGRWPDREREGLTGGMGGVAERKRMDMAEGGKGRKRGC